jgi:hypothetical protein
MKLLIINNNFLLDESEKKKKIIENPTFIPRKGDKIVWSFYRPPTVTDVIIDYEKQEILVIAK